MFSDSRAPAPAEQKGFKPHTPHFIPWLRNSLKPPHSSDLGLNGPYKSGSEARNNLSPLERAKGIGLFSIHGKNREKKGELRLNGMGMARILPVVLRGHQILPGSLRKQREDSPARRSQSPELEPEPRQQTSPADRPQGPGNSSTSAQNHHSSLLQLQTDGTGTLVRKYGPLVGPPPAAHLEEPNCKVPVVVGMEDRRGNVWDYASSTTYHQRQFHSSSWLSADNQGLTERQHGFTSSFSNVKHSSRNSKSHRDLTALREPPGKGFSGTLSGVLFSTEDPQRGLGCSTTLRGPRKHRAGSEQPGILGQNQTWAQYRPSGERELQGKEAGCSRKVVRNQIKRVVNNLEQVLMALRDVHQEMKEVVQQIEFLTSSVDLNEEDQQPSATGVDGVRPPSDSGSTSGSSSSSSEVTVGSFHRRPSEPKDKPGATESSGTLRPDHHRGSLSPPQVLVSTSEFLADRSGNFRFSSGLGSSLQHSNNHLSSSPPLLQDLTSSDFALSPQKSLPVRPPTPGVSPLTVNLPGSQPHSPGPSTSIKISPTSSLSAKPQPAPTICPAVIIGNKIRSSQSPESDHPSVVQACASSAQPPPACCPPTDSDTQTASADHREQPGPSAGRINRLPQVCSASEPPAKPLTAPSRRGRKPPPYPHHTKKVKEPRTAPPYPEKRRLLSTTV